MNSTGPAVAMIFTFPGHWQAKVTFVRSACSRRNAGGDYRSVEGVVGSFLKARNFGGKPRFCG
ncbi:MAG: hypothetical protein OXF88_16205, partial [Rhodobacteraceae bacterium]|nr:hypothetical protein [Paracoccaceae bacterium]